MSVTLRFCGAARTVTGSCLLFEAGETRFLVDCGMFQGPKSLKALNYEPFPFEPARLGFVLLTHAHIDHSGLLPRLWRQGFRGSVHATAATADLLSCMLPDAGHIQESEVEILNRRNRGRGRDPVEPIYTADDAERTLALLDTVEYGRWLAPARSIRARWWNAGHMLGSASIEIEFAGQDGTMRVLVSGDIGPDDGTMQPPPDAPRGGVDHVVVESTYGDEDRPTVTEAARREELARLARLAAERSGTLLIPTFAVERAQGVVLDLVRLMDEGRIPPTTIHLDSPLATRASRVFARHAAALDDAKVVRAALASPRLHYVADAAESRRLSETDGFQVVLAGSGMCEAGRIRGHLKARLGQAGTVVALVGYQATGTLGRLLQDGARRVRIQGDTYGVAARIARIEGYSAHADGPELGRWVAARAPIPGGVFLVHGEPQAIEGMARRLVGRGVVPDERVIRPVLDEVFTLGAGEAPRRESASARRLLPEAVGLPDWHNARAALLLEMEAVLDEAGDDAARLAVLDRIRTALRQG
jgi:metallo-beta-lactamase family protein